MTRPNGETILEALGRGPIHPFPARMAPGIALDAIGNARKLRVLDPMSGSGTVLAVARERGHQAFGVDLDPLAVLLARVWTRPLDSLHINGVAERVLIRAKARFADLPVGASYPAAADDETRAFLRYWFDPYARRQLTALSTEISRIDDDVVRDALWCAFSRLIITKSAGASLAMDLSHSRPHRSFVVAPVKPFNRFLAATAAVTTNCPKLGDSTGPSVEIAVGDARKLTIGSESIDLVLTSPPYLNAIDYMRCSKFSLVWMGNTISDLRKIRRESVGAEACGDSARNSKWVAELLGALRLTPKLSTRNHALLSQYTFDMNGSLAEVSRVLKPGGRAVYVVGDSTVRGTFVSNSKVVTLVAQRNGLILRSRHTRTLPANRRYLPPPKAGNDLTAIESRMRREVVLEFKKPA